jgi:hypothetical protein
MIDLQSKVVYQVISGYYPMTTVLHEASTHADASSFLDTVKGKGTNNVRVISVHLAWVQDAWRKINPVVVSSRFEDYSDFNDSTLKSAKETTLTMKCGTAIFTRVFHTP